MKVLAHPPDVRPATTWLQRQLVSGSSHKNEPRHASANRFGGVETLVAQEAKSEANKGITRLFQWFEKNPISALVAQDVMCFNIPPFLLARTKSEFLDIAPNLLGWTSITAGSTIALPPLLRRIASPISGVPVKHMATQLSEAAMEKMPQAEKLARLGVSFGFLFPFGAGFMATPFFRNYLTLKRTGTTDFEKIIGLRKEGTSDNSQAVNGRDDPKYKAALKKNLRAGWAVLAGGFGLGAASLAAFSVLARRSAAGKQLLNPELVQKLLNTYGLRGKTSNEVSGTWPILLFWLAPPYLGWLMAARSKNERIEYAVKSANSILWFSLFTPMFLKGTFARAFEKIKIPTQVEQVKNPIAKGMQANLPSYQKLLSMADGPQKEQALKILNRYSIASWVVPITMLATTPQLLNIVFTKRRFAAQEKLLQDAAQRQRQESPNTVQTNVLFANSEIGAWGTTNSLNNGPGGLPKSALNGATLIASTSAQKNAAPTPPLPAPSAPVIAPGRPAVVSGLSASDLAAIRNLPQG